MKWSRLVSPALWTLDNHSFGFQVLPSHRESEDHNSQRIQWWPGKSTWRCHADEWQLAQDTSPGLLNNNNPISITVPLGLLPGAGNQFGTKCMQLRSFLTFAKQLNQCQGLCFWNSLYNFIYSNSQKRIGRYFQDSLLLMYFSYFQLSSPFLSLTLGIAIWQCVKTLDPWWTSK